jgi:hypothetical protein
MNRLVAWPWRRALAAFCLAWLAAYPTLAQDPRATAAQAAALDWLVLVDRGNAQASWNAAGTKFRNALSLPNWANELRKERTPRGAVKSRTALKTDFQKAIAGVPEGDYALVSYATSFANHAQGHESLTLEREADGRWRVIGYFVR